MVREAKPRLCGVALAVRDEGDGAGALPTLLGFRRFLALTVELEEDVEDSRTGGRAREAGSFPIVFAVGVGRDGDEVEECVGLSVEVAATPL